MGTVNNGANSYILKINKNHTTESLTLSGDAVNRRINSSCYTLDGKLLFQDTDENLITLDPITNIHSKTTIMSPNDLTIQCKDKYGNVYLTPNAETNFYFKIGKPIIYHNKELLAPVFNNQK